MDLPHLVESGSGNNDRNFNWFFSVYWNFTTEHEKLTMISVTSNYQIWPLFFENETLSGFIKKESTLIKSLIFWQDMV